MKERFALDGGKIALALLVLILCYQVVIPLAMIIWTSFKVARPGSPNFSTLACP